MARGESRPAECSIRSLRVFPAPATPPSARRYRARSCRQRGEIPGRRSRRTRRYSCRARAGNESQRSGRLTFQAHRRAAPTIRCRRRSNKRERGTTRPDGVVCSCESDGSLAVVAASPAPQIRGAGQPAAKKPSGRGSTSSDAPRAKTGYAGDAPARHFALRKTIRAVSGRSMAMSLPDARSRTNASTFSARKLPPIGS